MRKKIKCDYDTIISIENLLLAWREFERGKKKRKDVQEFEQWLMEHIIALHADLANKTYRHGAYQHFVVIDPKRRDIHKAPVRDRLLHHALYRVLYPHFDAMFISDSYSCRKGKGTYKALDVFSRYARQVSKNHTRTAWVLKCDIKKFFASVDHDVLLSIINNSIADNNIIWLVSQIVDSFHGAKEGTGLPLGNLTSQLLVNIYMNVFDQYVKHIIKVKHYIRYADDFVLLSHDRDHLLTLLPKISRFLTTRLKLTLHPNKVSISTVASGVDFLGWTHFPDHRTLRTVTRRRLIKKLANDSDEATKQSYFGLLEHGNGWKIKNEVWTRG